MPFNLCALTGPEEFNFLGFQTFETCILNISLKEKLESNFFFSDRTKNLDSFIVLPTRYVGVNRSREYIKRKSMNYENSR